jgi:peptide/nickel transport system permease protein
MPSYVLRRLFIGAFTLLLISLLIYALIRSAPGDPATYELSTGDLGGETPLSREAYEALKRDFGLDRPWLLAYLEWLGRLARGDLGASISPTRRGLPVGGLILEAIGPTLLLSSISLLCAYVLSVPLGLYATRRSGKPDERALSAFLYILHSFPSYVVAIFLLLVVSVQLDLLPLSGMKSDDFDELTLAGKLWDLLLHLALPVTCYTYGSLAYYARFVRSNLMEVVRQDYIRTARAKGLGEGAVLVRHALRNALLPLVTLFGLSLPALVSGSVILERIFAWPGMGQLFLDALNARDYPLIMGIAMVFSVLVLIGTLLADVLYAVVDPRVTYS